MSEKKVNSEQGRFLPAFFCDIVEMGEVFKSGLPEHITLFPPVQEPYTDDYSIELRRAVNPKSSFNVKVGEHDQFGPNHDIEVFKIKESIRLQKIHTAITSVLERLLHDPTYRRPYNPHISTNQSTLLRPGSNINIGGFSVVEKTADGNWMVVDKVGFKGE